MNKAKNKKIRALGNKGFSLVELIVVIGIMGVLAAVLVPTFSRYMENARIAADDAIANNLRHNVELMCNEEQYQKTLKTDCTIALSDKKVVFTGFNVADDDAKAQLVKFATDLLESVKSKPATDPTAASPMTISNLAGLEFTSNTRKGDTTSDAYTITIKLDGYVYSVTGGWASEATT